MCNTLCSFFVCLILSCSVITLNAASQEPFVFSEEEARIKNELIAVFDQLVGLEAQEGFRDKALGAGAKLDRVRVEALETKKNALLNWIHFDFVEGKTSILGNNYSTQALEDSLTYLINTNQRSIASSFMKKDLSVISGDLFPRAETIDVYEFLLKKGAMLSLILEMHKSMTAFTLENTLEIADLLTLKHLTFGGAYAEGAILQKLLGFDMREFVKRLNENFKLSTFKRVNEHFESKVWAGHVSYSTEKVVPQLDSHTKIIYGECVLQGNGLGVLAEIPGPAECGDDSKITYAFRKPKNEKLSLIIIEIYGGWTKDIAEAPKITALLSDTSIGLIHLSLPDCISDVRQWDQLKPENFLQTHARYMRIASDFIKRIKDTYPGLPVFLKGDSFGGFFVSSYALLQSIGLNTAEFENVYHDFVKEGFKENFGNKKFSMIDGVISCFGGTYYMDQIVHKSGWPQYLTIPAFYHFNFDDDRIEFSSAVNAVLTPEDDYNPFVSLSIKRRAVEGFLMGIDSLGAADKEDVKLIFEDACAGKTSILGHSSPGSKDFDEKVVHFVRSSRAITPLRIARQKRLFKMYKNERQRFFKLSDFNTKDLCYDLTQFLRNLKRLKKEQASGASFTEEQRFDNAMYLIYENSSDMFQKFGSIASADSLARLHELIDMHSQDLKSVQDKDSLVETDRQECQKLIDPFLLDVETEISEWKEFYKMEMKSYYEKLMHYATIKGFLSEDLTEEDVGKKLSFIRSKDEDLQQFLSNLQNTQKQIEKSGQIRGAALIESHMTLVNGDIDQVCLDFGKSLKDAGKDGFDVFVKEKKEHVKEFLSDAMPQNLQNQVLVDELVMYSGFKEFYGNAQTEYHDELMQSVSTRGLWKEAFKAVKLHIWKERVKATRELLARIEAKRELATLRLVEDSIPASRLWFLLNNCSSYKSTHQ
jgi:hypothetical protein